MNEKAKAILMEKTNFADPSGVSPANLSTARDLFYLARYILTACPPLLKISKGEEVETFGIPVRFSNLENKNIFSGHPNFLGGKTGYTPFANNTGIFIFGLTNQGNLTRKIVIILLGAEYLKRDMEGILGWLKENYHFAK